jgi:hypothetical protein
LATTFFFFTTGFLTTGLRVAITPLGGFEITRLITGFFGTTFFTAVTFFTTLVLLGPLPFWPETTIWPFSTETSRHAVVQSAAMAVDPGNKSAISKGAVINALFVFIMGAGYVNRWQQNPSSRAHVDTYATLEPW